MLALALHGAGQTDREIADANNTSVNNIIAWRREAGLPENLSAAAKARAQEEQYTSPVRRVSPPRAGSAAARKGDAPPAAEPRLITPAQAQADYVAPVQPTGDNALEIGIHVDRPVFVDLEELLTTRLLIQGNSGSGKSHLLRRLLEECAGIVQQVIIDPEGDFVSFGDAFGHTVINAKDFAASRLCGIAAKARHLRGSIVLSLEGIEIEQQMDAVSAFLSGLFDAPPEHWHPIIVAIDEAHLYAPAGDNGEDKETRKSSQQAVANLMCRGRKRGLAGIIATQRLSKLHKNVAAEASNFLLGRTFLDIDIARAADLLGLQRAQAEDIRNLSRGEFLGLGPAIARRPLKVKVGSVITLGKAGPEKGLTPLPSLTAEAMQSLMLADEDGEDLPVAPALRIVK
ncbi:DUF87 domain-containing protein [Sphingomonas montanisoli]|uniref:DUF87 domain-containing protein n=2 Tax=Sphingomonas montanisoli TaxID=2606412 RepID=A0A5D9CEI8_9SPHN|nr:DUF87 domain-containing protein [Sphingomonas montanisoli]